MRTCETAVVRMLDSYTGIGAHPLRYILVLALAESYSSSTVRERAGDCRRTVQRALLPKQRVQILRHGYLKDDHSQRVELTSTHRVTWKKTEVNKTRRGTMQVGSSTYHFVKFVCSSREYGSLKPAKGQPSKWVSRKNQLAATLPEQIMCQQVFGPFRCGSHFLCDMLKFVVSSTLNRVLGSAIVDMDVSTECFAHQVAHHRRAFIIRREPSPTDLEAFFVWTVDRPSDIRHGTMARFVFLLGMT